MNWYQVAKWSFSARRKYFKESSKFFPIKGRIVFLYLFFVLGILMALPLVHALLVEREWSLLSEEIQDEFGQEYTKLESRHDPSPRLEAHDLNSNGKGGYVYSKKTFCYLSVMEYVIYVDVTKRGDVYELEWESTFIFHWKLF